MGEVTILYYDPSINLMRDCNGNEVFNIFSYITPDMYKLFLHDKEYKLYEPEPGVFVEMIYPDDIETRY